MALRPQLSRGRAGAPPRGWWPSGLASVSEAGGPGLGSSLARALFCVAVSWYPAAGSSFRGSAMDFCFQPLDIAGLLLKSLLAPLRGSTFTFEAFSAKSRHAAPADIVVRRHADVLQFSNRWVFLRGFAQSRRHSLQHGACLLEARVLLSHGARKASLMSSQLFAFAFPLARNFATGRAPLVPHRSLLAARHPRARLLLLATFRYLPRAVVLAAWLPPPAPKFGFLSCAGNLLRLALGNGIWVGGIEIKALDDFRFEKSTS